MKRVVIAGMTAVVMLAGCSGDDASVTTTSVTPTTAPAETTTTAVVTTTTAQPDPSPAAGLFDVVGAAALALLDMPALASVELRYDENAVLTSSRWTDWRMNGDFVMVAFSNGGLGSVAQVGESLLSAATDVSRSEPWTAKEPLLPTAGNPDGVFGSHLRSLADGVLLAELVDIPPDEIEVTSEQTDDGGTIWTLRHPHFVGDATIIRHWTIDTNGVLRSFTLTSDSDGLPFGAFATAEFSFDPLLDPLPIVLPEEGTELDIAVLNLPSDLPLPGE